MPKPLLYGLSAVFVLAAGWFIYTDRAAVAGKSLPTITLKK
jgi:hypothetical protein